MRGWPDRCALAISALLLITCGDDDGSRPTDAGPRDEGLDAATADDAADDAADGARDAAVAIDSGPAPGAVGAACTGDTDCRAGLTCFLGPEGARAWPDGYCTRPCVQDGDCPGDALCGPAYYDGDTPDLRCLARCDREAESHGGCRDGYRCHYDGICRVGCSSDAQCQMNDTDPGPPTIDPEWTCNLASSRCVHEGNADARALGDCTGDSDCRAPRGVCNGGRCFQIECDLGGDYACADGEVCVSLYNDPPRRTFFCFPECVPGEDGRGEPTDRCGGFACLPREKDAADLAESAFCFPIPTGGAGTALIGDACARASDCRNEFGYDACIDGQCIASFCAAPSLAGLDLCTDPGATCFVPEPTGEYIDHDSALGICTRDCSADPSVCAPGASCQMGYCL